MKITTNHKRQLPTEVNITLSGEQALLLAILVGGVAGTPTNPLRAMTNQLYELLVSVPEIRFSAEKFHHGEFLTSPALVKDGVNDRWRLIALED